MSEMEPEIRDFLVKVASSFSMSALWMLINATLGIGFNYAFFKSTPSLGNYIFYAWFLASLTALLWYLKRKWEL